MSEPLDELGLDIAPFKRAIAEANATMEKMSPTLQKVNATIAKMEQQSAKTADAFKKQNSAAVALESELRKLQKLEATNVSSRSRQERIEQLKKEAPIQRALADSLSRQAVAQAAAAAQAKVEAKKATPAIQRADRAAQAAEQAEGDGSAKALITRAGFIAATGVVLHKLGNAIMELGDKAGAAIDKFQKGGSRLSANMPDRESAALSTGLKPIVEDATNSFTNRLTTAAMGVMASIGGVLSKITGGKSGADNYWAGIEAIRKEGESALKVKEAIAGQEDALSDMLKTQTAEYDSQMQILEKHVEIEREKLKLANLDTEQGRAAANQAKAAIGQLELEMSTRKFQRDQQINAAKAETTEMDLKQKGMSNIAAMVKIEAEFRAKIAQSIREGNSELTIQLQLQQQMELNEARAKEHNLSNADLRGERKQARKFQRDVNHEIDREADMADRIKRGVHGATPGSRLDRFQAGRRAAAGNAQNMTVNTITSTNLNVSTLKLTNQ